MRTAMTARIPVLPVEYLANYSVICDMKRLGKTDHRIFS